MKISDTELKQVNGGSSDSNESFLTIRCAECTNEVQVKVSPSNSVVICPHCNRCINIR